MTIPHPHAYSDSPQGKYHTPSFEDVSPNAGYRHLDDIEMAIARGIHEMRLADRTGYATPRTRTAAELVMHWGRWLVSGRNTFRVGPETLDKIEKRLESGDVPTDPVPPAYFQFDRPLAEYATNRPLNAAYISRGLLGRITFLSDESTHASGALTVMLPSVFRAEHISILETSLKLEQTGTASEASQSLARALNEEHGLPESVVNMMAEQIEGIGTGPHTHGGTGSMPGMSGQDNGPPRIDFSVTLQDKMLDPLPGKPGPLLPRAAKIVLIAADEARKADKQYGAPEYMNTSKMERLYIENADIPVETRADITALP